MTTYPEPQKLRRARVHRLLRSTRYILLCVGILALGYVGFTLVEAHVSQANALRSLEAQIRAQQDQKVSQPKAVIKEGDVLGRMDIPRLGMSVAVLQGTDTKILKLGAGHIEGTALPGEAGNSGIAGHRDTFFRDLKDIRPNDEIQLQTATGLVRYEVDWVKVVAPNEISVLAPSTGSALTLVTCYPFYFLGAAPKRFIVHAQKH